MNPDEEIPKDQIRERAYDLWERNHRPTGFDLEFWFMAERELRFERRVKAGRDGCAVGDPRVGSST